jgi:hypothetical protein
MAIKVFEFGQQDRFGNPQHPYDIATSHASEVELSTATVICQVVPTVDSYITTNGDVPAAGDYFVPANGLATIKVTNPAGAAVTIKATAA